MALVSRRHQGLGPRRGNFLKGLSLRPGRTIHPGVRGRKGYADLLFPRQ